MTWWQFGLGLAGVVVLGFVGIVVWQRANRHTAQHSCGDDDDQRPIRKHDGSGDYYGMGEKRLGTSLAEARRLMAGFDEPAQLDEPEDLVVVFGPFAEDVEAGPPPDVLGTSPVDKEDVDRAVRGYRNAGPAILAVAEQCKRNGATR